MILTVSEAISTLGEHSDTVDESRLTDEIEAVEAYITRATGYVVAGTIDPVAKKLARMLLVQWWDNPDGQTTRQASDYGVQNLIVQLRASVARSESA